VREKGDEPVGDHGSKRGHGETPTKKKILMQKIRAQSHLKWGGVNCFATWFSWSGSNFARTAQENTEKREAQKRWGREEKFMPESAAP